ncbi:hypothetical protein FAVG1_11474 [Fusarium avenaceum]|nr:hypothetical protein FAVG1_11474 [Fusarium avenaceum]
MNLAWPVFWRLRIVVDVDVRGVRLEIDGSRRLLDGITRRWYGWGRFAAIIPIAEFLLFLPFTTPQAITTSNIALIVIACFGTFRSSSESALPACFHSSQTRLRSSALELV